MGSHNSAAFLGLFLRSKCGIIFVCTTTYVHYLQLLYTILRTTYILHTSYIHIYKARRLDRYKVQRDPSTIHVRWLGHFLHHKPHLITSKCGHECFRYRLRIDEWIHQSNVAEGDHYPSPSLHRFPRAPSQGQRQLCSSRCSLYILLFV